MADSTEEVTPELDADGNPIIKCTDCEKVIDEDDGSAWSPITGEPYCYGCEQSDLEHASTLLRFDADGLTEVTFGDAFVRTESDIEIPDWFNELFAYGFKVRSYHSSNAWRGYYETDTLMVNLKSLASGWTTGMPDETVSRKADFNELGELLNRGQEVAPAPIYFLIEPTSNIFSQAMTVLAKESDIETLTEWLDSIGYAVEVIKTQLS
jgi:hypothetical protein